MTVTKEEFDKFIQAYPRELLRDVFHANEPPIVTYNDFTLGDWPDSVVAAYSVGDLPGAHYYYGPDSNFKIRVKE